MFAIEYIKLFNQGEYSKYEKPSAGDLSKNAGAENIRIQGEKYAYTNSQT